VTAEHDHAADAVDLLREQLGLALTSLELLDRKLALLTPVVAGIAALTAPDKLQGQLSVGLLGAGLVVAAISAGLALFGLFTRPAALGPEPRRLAWRIRVPYPDYHADAAQALQHAVVQNIALGLLKARYFNLAAIAAACAILILVAARIVEGLPGS
jgi:hypothetical protein